jgi:DHA1 family tetracycline resistance protein-like MFS transporter
VLASLNAAAMITAPLVMTFTFAQFTAPDAPIFAPGAPFLLAAALMLAAIALHIAKPLAKPQITL